MYTAHPTLLIGPSDWQAERMAVYAAMIEAMDRGVGRILDKLKEQGRLDNALVLLLADNGGCAEDIPSAWRGDKFPEKTRDGRPEYLRAACDESLQRLRVERIDLYQYHRHDPDVPFAESVGALEELRREIVEEVG